MVAPWKERAQEGLWQPNAENAVLTEINDRRYHSTKKLNTPQDFANALADILGGRKKNLQVAGPKEVQLFYDVDVDTLVDHLVNHVDAKGKPYTDLERSRFVAMIGHTMLDPEEIRVGFLRSESGKVAIRSSFYSRYKDFNGTSRVIQVTFDARKASFASHTTLTSAATKVKMEGVRIYKKS